jgi:hypothetical protein
MEYPGNIAVSEKESECVYPDWDGGFTREKHIWDRDGFCIICGTKREEAGDQDRTGDSLLGKDAVCRGNCNTERVTQTTKL